MSPQIEVRTEGGHSSIPRPHSSIGYLAMIIASVEFVYSDALSSVDPRR